MRILITGATGFLGAALSRQLEEQGHEITRLHSRNCDLREGKSLQAFGGQSYDRIYHLAAWTQAGDFCLHHPGEQWIINQQINTNVLAWWRDTQAQAKLVCIGTSCSYDPALSLTEDNYLAGTPIESLFTYAMSKRMMYVGLLALQKQFGMKYLHLVPSTLYGGGYHTDGRQMHFIFDLIRKILRGHLYNEPVVLWGDGHQRRELIHLNDFVSLAIALPQNLENETINIGAGEEHTIRHFAELICKYVGYDFEKIQFDTTRYVGAKSKCLNIDKLKGLCPELQLTPLETGLKDTIDWFWREKETLLPSGS